MHKAAGVRHQIAGIVPCKWYQAAGIVPCKWYQAAGIVYSANGIRQQALYPANGIRQQALYPANGIRQQALYPANGSLRIHQASCAVGSITPMFLISNKQPAPTSILRQHSQQAKQPMSAFNSNATAEQSTAPFGLSARDQSNLFDPLAQVLKFDVVMVGIKGDCLCQD